MSGINKIEIIFNKIKKYKNCPHCNKQKCIKSRKKDIEFYTDKTDISLHPSEYQLVIRMQTCDMGKHIRNILRKSRQCGKSPARTGSQAADAQTRHRAAHGGDGQCYESAAHALPLWLWHGPARVTPPPSEYYRDGRRSTRQTVALRRTARLGVISKRLLASPPRQSAQTSRSRPGTRANSRTFAVTMVSPWATQVAASQRS